MARAARPWVVVAVGLGAALAGGPVAIAGPPGCPTLRRVADGAAAGDLCGLGLGYWPGPLVTWELTATDDVEVRVALPLAPSAEVDLAVGRATDPPSRCLTAAFSGEGARAASFVAERGKVYRVYAAGRHGTEVVGEVTLTCSGEQSRVVAPLGCGDRRAGTLAGAPSVVSAYRGIGYSLGSPERAYLLRTASDVEATFTLDFGAGPDLALLVLDASGFAPAHVVAHADEAQEDGGAPGEALTADLRGATDYLVVVDAALPEAADFVIDVKCRAACAASGCEGPGIAATRRGDAGSGCAATGRLPAAAGLFVAVTLALAVRRRRRLTSVVVAVTLLALARAGSAATVDARLAEIRHAARAGDALPVLVRLRRGDATPWPAAGRAGPALLPAVRAAFEDARRDLTAFLRANGVRVHRVLALDGSLALAATPALLDALASRPDVEELRLDATLRLPSVLAPSATVTSGAGWNLEALGAPAVWQTGRRGEGAVVAILDTGVDLAHPDVGPRWRGSPGDWLDPYGEHATPHDQHGHGTQVASLIVGGDSSGTPVGVAPAARFIAAKVFDDRGGASLSAVHQALEWALDPDGDPATDDGADVVNCSFAFADAPDRCSTEFARDIALLRSAGVPVIVAAGNAGPSPRTSVSPANDPGAWSVGAMSSTDVAGFSSRGPSACGGAVYPTLVAPGVGVLAADLTGGGIYPSSYTEVDGTSFAAAQVSGALALLRGAFPSAPASSLEGALVDSAGDLGPPGPDDVFGYGSADLVAALLSLDPGLCRDADGDGAPREALCGGPADCDDSDPSRSPLTPEIPHDGVDQNCNGLDLTITARGGWFHSLVRVEVIARSDLGADAALTLSGATMSWDAVRSVWHGLAPSPGSGAGEIVVSGREGELAVPLEISWRTLWRAGVVPRPLEVSPRRDVSSAE